jgi:predicted TIM-barrel fold metal-dependent hydrolase
MQIWLSGGRDEARIYGKDLFKPSTESGGHCIKDTSIPDIDQVALDSPELAIVGGHIGYLWTEEMIDVSTKHPNVYIDASAYTAKRYPISLVSTMSGHGRKKVLFGTNWPMIAPRKALEDLDAFGLDKEARELFLAGNAARVFKLRVLQ